MLRTLLPICFLIFSPAPQASAQSSEAASLREVFLDFPINPNFEPPRPRCLYSFYLGRNWIQIRDNYGQKHDCAYYGSSGSQNYYVCMNAQKQPTENQVEVAVSGWGVIKWVKFVASEDLTAYCD